MTRVFGSDADGGDGRGGGGPDAPPPPPKNPFLPAGLYTGGGEPTTTAPYFTSGLPGSTTGAPPYATAGVALENLIRRAGHRAVTAAASEKDLAEAVGSYAATAPAAAPGPTTVPFGQRHANTIPTAGEKEMQALLAEGAENRRFISRQSDFLHMAAR